MFDGKSSVVCYAFLPVKAMDTIISQYGPSGTVGLGLVTDPPLCYFLMMEQRNLMLSGDLPYPVIHFKNIYVNISRICSLVFFYCCNCKDFECTKTATYKPILNQ